jgi:hypothetical protein
MVRHVWRLAGGRLYAVVTVGTKGELVPFADWTRPEQVTLRDLKGRSSSLLPLRWPEERGKVDGVMPEWEYGAGKVTPDCVRYTILEFDGAVPTTGDLELDLDGGPVGWVDPIRSGSLSPRRASRGIRCCGEERGLVTRAGVFPAQPPSSSFCCSAGFAGE